MSRLLFNVISKFKNNLGYLSWPVEGLTALKLRKILKINVLKTYKCSFVE